MGFAYGSDTSLNCFDENSPCTLEQESMNVIANNEQSVYVPWLVCMHSSGDKLKSCDSQVGISKPARTAPAALVSEYMAKVSAALPQLQGTPAVYVNGAYLKTSYTAIRNSLCAADASLKGCSAVDPKDADNEIHASLFCTRPTGVA